MRVRQGTQMAGDHFGLLPPGWYLCEIERVDEKKSNNNDVMWALTFKVCEGEKHAGRLIWDNLTWNEKGEPRILKLMHRLGYSDDTDLTTRHLQGKQVLVEVVVEKCKLAKSKHYGKDINSVPYGGFDFANPLDRQAYEDLKKAAKANPKPERQPGEDDFPSEF